MLLNPNCSTIVCALPTYRNIKIAEKILDELLKLDMKDETRNELRNVLYEWSYDERYEISTESHNTGAIDDFIRCAEQLKKDMPDIKNFPEPRYVDNLGGGGHWESVETCWKIAKLYVFGKLTEDEARKLDDMNGCGPLLLEECEKCLKDKPVETCTECVKRIVGECKGRFGQSVAEKIKSMEREAINAIEPKL